MIGYGAFWNSTTSELFRFLMRRMLFAPFTILLHLKSSFQLLLILIGKIRRALAHFAF